MEVLVTALDAPTNDVSILPRGSVEELATRSAEDVHGPESVLTSEEVGWMQALAAGKRVHEIAEAAGFAERSMFRRLYRVYSALGAGTRTEALLAAERLGLLRDSLG